MITQQQKLKQLPANAQSMSLKELRQLNIDRRRKDDLIRLQSLIEQKEFEELVKQHEQNIMNKLLKDHLKEEKKKKDNNTLNQLQGELDQIEMQRMLKKQIKKNQQQLQTEVLIQISNIQNSTDIDFLKKLIPKSKPEIQYIITNRIQTIYQQKVDSMTEEQIDSYIKSHESYDINKEMEMQFFYKHINRIMNAHKNESVIQFTPENAPVKLTPVKQELIDKINIYLYGVLQNGLDEIKYDSLEKQLCKCLNVKFISAKKVDLKDQDLFKQLKEFQQNYNYFEDDTFYPTEKYIKKQGAYFNYYLTIPEINLNRQQIFNSDSKMQLKGQNEEGEDLFINQYDQEHCFIHSLIQSGEYTQNEINEIKLQIVCVRGNLSLENIKLITGLKPLIISSVDSTIDNKVRYSYVYNGKVSYKKLNDVEFKTEISCFKNHYFINELSPCTLNFIKHYETYKNDERYKNYMLLQSIKNRNGTISFNKSSDSKTTVLELVKCLFDLGYFKEKSEMNIFNQQQSFDLTHPPQILYQQTEKEDSENQEDQEEDSENQEDTKKKVYDKIMTADFETFTTNGKLNANGQLERIVHKEFLLCYAELTGQIRHGRNIMSLINYLKNEYLDSQDDKHVLCYFHNFGYDASYIMFKNIPLSSPLKFNGKIIGLQSRIQLPNKNAVFIKFVDSNLLFQCALKKLPKQFFPNEKIVKELFPYDYYTEQRYLKNVGNIKDALPFVEKADYQQFKDSISAADSLIGQDCFDMQKYALYYCKIDVDILRKSILVFQTQLKSEFDLDVTDYISISSLASQYQKKQKCFENVEPVKGLLRKYLQQFIIGGRCMLQNNTKIQTVIELLDFDAVSLYPSAMSQIYFPVGKPQHLTKEMLSYYNVPENLFKIRNSENSEDQNSLFMTVKFTLTNDFIPRDFPLQSVVDSENGSRNFTNNIFDKYFHLDHIALQDIVNFQKVKYEIVSGIYYEGRNYKIQNTIKNMFDQRVYYKQQENPVESTYKLMLNSLYGKTIEKDRLTENKICTEEQFKKLIQQKFQYIEDVVQIGSKYFVTMKKELTDQEGFQQVGSLILSMSKRITNEVMCLAEDLGIKIYYTDTDSMHIEKGKIELLEREYQKIYNRPLVGSALGQFHSDFSSKLNKKDKNIYAVESIFVDKKIYVDKIVVTLPDQQKVFDYHFRCKGITETSIEQQRDITYDGDILKLYQDMFDGKAVTFDMLAGRPSFDLKNFEYISLNSFNRKIHIQKNQQ
ncbi:DNA_polymerase [Hexamita inflata]|uniref:DNA-directed DNA polymerase n=1 Tax=Hexamita inflata TaxID=28002 RepID=A0AA86P8G7_9EUKA|nr:DNA polymerase [Hexamita inflata]